jgi:phage terminase small subunit
MTPKQERFVQEYLIDLNATQAAIRAGYSTRTADKKGPQLVGNSSIKSAIDSALEERRRKTDITAQYVLENLREVVERCLQRAPVLNAKGQQAQDEKGKNLWVFNAGGANKALELLGKHLGMFIERTELTGKDGGALEISAPKVDLSALTDEELETYAALSAKARGEPSASA